MSLGQARGYSLSRTSVSGSFTSCNQGVICGCSHSRESTSKFTHLVVDRIYIFAAFWTEATLILCQTGSLQKCASWESNRESNKMEVTVCFNVITEVPSITFAISYSLAASHYIQPRSRRWGSLGVMSAAAYPVITNSS